MTKPLAYIVARLDDRGTIVYKGSLAECELWIARQPAPGEYYILAIGLPMEPSASLLSLKAAQIDIDQIQIELKAKDDEEE